MEEGKARQVKSGRHTNSQTAVVLVVGDEVEGGISHGCAIFIGWLLEKEV